MIYLSLSILSSTAIFILFKLFKKHNVNTLHAIVVNYITAGTCGIVFSEQSTSFPAIVNSSWVYVAIALGFLFISIFNVMALTAQKNGLSVASVASKMSVIIPILFGILIYKESIGIQKTTGIILALVAVFLTSIKRKDDTVLTQSVYLPLLLFFGSGIIDTSVNHFAPENNIPLFLTVIFAVAGFIGIIISIYNVVQNESKFKFKAVPFGFALGTVNYGSMYFLLKALRIEGFESSNIFTINNVAIVGVSALVGLILFKEHISKQNWLGILIAIASIILVTI